MDLKLRREAGWLGVNGLLAVGFLGFSCTMWIEPDLKNVPGASGGAPIVFGLLVLWLLGILLIVNLIWTAFAVHRGIRSGDWRSLLIICVAGVVWVCLVVFSASNI